MMWRRMLVVSSLGIVGLIAMGGDAFARTKYYSTGSKACYSVVSHAAVAAPSAASCCPPSCVAYKQCRGTYFDTGSSAWFETDLLVNSCCAEVGVSVTAKVGKLGYLTVWITEVYAKPKLGPPAFAAATASPSDAPSPKADASRTPMAYVALKR